MNTPSISSNPTNIQMWQVMKKLVLFRAALHYIDKRPTIQIMVNFKTKLNVCKQVKTWSSFDQSHRNKQHKTCYCREMFLHRQTVG